MRAYRVLAVATLAVTMTIAGCSLAESKSGGSPKPVSVQADAAAVKKAGPSAAAAPAATKSAGTHGGHANARVVAPTFQLAPGDRNLNLKMPTPYRPKASPGTDDYRCFLLDPKLTSTEYLTGIGFMPGNPKIVHHSILFRVSPTALPAAQKADADSPGDGWTCFGDAGISNGAKSITEQLSDAPWLAAWAPGGKPETFEKGYGIEVTKGTRFVLQVHYNLRAGDGADQTELRLRVTPASKKVTPLNTTLLPAPIELPCAPGEQGPLCARNAAVADVARRFGMQARFLVEGLQSVCGGDPAQPKAGPTQSCDRRIDKPFTLHATAGHMHLLGRAIKIEINPGTAKARTVLNVTSWNFDDQSARPLPTAVRVQAGDVVRVTCTHDAGLRAQLPDLQNTPPRYVVWGEGTTDEMCLGVLRTSA